MSAPTTSSRSNVPPPPDPSIDPPPKPTELSASRATLPSAMFSLSSTSNTNFPPQSTHPAELAVTAVDELLALRTRDRVKDAAVEILLEKYTNALRLLVTLQKTVYKDVKLTSLPRGRTFNHQAEAMEFLSDKITEITKLEQKVELVVSQSKKLHSTPINSDAALPSIKPPLVEDSPSAKEVPIVLALVQSSSSKPTPTTKEASTDEPRGAQRMEHKEMMALKDENRELHKKLEELTKQFASSKVSSLPNTASTSSNSTEVTFLPSPPKSTEPSPNLAPVPRFDPPASAPVVAIVAPRLQKTVEPESATPQEGDRDDHEEEEEEEDQRDETVVLKNVEREEDEIDELDEEEEVVEPRAGKVGEDGNKKKVVEEEGADEPIVGMGVGEGEEEEEEEEDHADDDEDGGAGDGESEGGMVDVLNGLGIRKAGGEQEDGETQAAGSDSERSISTAPTTDGLSEKARGKQREVTTPRPTIQSFGKPKSTHALAVAAQSLSSAGEGLVVHQELGTPSDLHMDSDTGKKTSSSVPLIGHALPNQTNARALPLPTDPSWKSGDVQGTLDPSFFVDTPTRISSSFPLTSTPVPSKTTKPVELQEGPRKRLLTQEVVQLDDEDEDQLDSEEEQTPRAHHHPSTLALQAGESMDSASSTRLRLLTNASKSGPSESKDPGPSSLREASGENLDDLSAILFNLMVEVEEEEEEEQEADGSDESDGDGSSTSSLLQQSSSRAPVDGARTLRSRSSNLSSASSAASIKKGRKKVEKEEEEMDASVDGERPAEPDSKILIDGHEFLYRSLLNLKEPLEIPLDTVVTPFKKSIQAKAHSPNPTLSAYHVDAVVSNPDASLSVVLEALLPPAATVDDIQQLREWTLLVASYPTSVDHGKLAREFAAKNPSFGSRSALFQSLSDAKAAQTAALIQYRSFIAMVLLYVVLGQRSAVARFISSREGREMTFGEILLEKEPKQRGKGETRVLLMKYGSIFRDLWHVEGAYRAAVRSVKGTT